MSNIIWFKNYLNHLEIESKIILFKYKPIQNLCDKNKICLKNLLTKIKIAQVNLSKLFDRNNHWFKKYFLRIKFNSKIISTK